MKTLSIALIICVGLGACQVRSNKSAGEQPLDVTKDTATFTTIQWIDTTYQDLGTVKEGPEVEIDYKFRNTGDKNLIIEDVQASCGCTIVEKPKQPYLPGETGTI